MQFKDLQFKAPPYALAAIATVLAVLVLGTVWFMSGKRSAPPPAVNGPTLTPEQEAMRQAQGESHLGKDQGGAARDQGDTGGK